LLEKSKKEDIAVYITKMKKYETTVTPCDQQQIQELISLGSGSFLSLDNILNDSNAS
jgi:hypothetical protein